MLVCQVGGLHLGTDFGNQAGNAMQVDRGSSRIPGLSENMTQLSGPPGPSSLVPGQMGAANQPHRPQSVSVMNQPLGCLINSVVV